MNTDARSAELAPDAPLAPPSQRLARKFTCLHMLVMCANANIIQYRRSDSSTNTAGKTVPSRFPLKPPFHHTAKLRDLKDPPALGKAELVVG